ncbi:MAG: hypothetical protein Q7S40_13105 [Opitutaceae bacterium]|nr:hypothetical protein [Opitutaceae bacterium]
MTLNTSYNFFHEINDTRSHALATGGVASAAVPNLLATVDASGNRTGGGFIRPGYTDTFTQTQAGPQSTSILTLTSNDKSGRTYLVSPRVRHRWDTMLIDYSLSWSNSATYYDVSHNNEKYGSKPKGTINYRLANVGWSVDRSQDRIWPTIRQTEGPDLNNLNNYGTLLLTQNDQRGFDTVINGKLDLKKILPVRIPMYVKTGFSYQHQYRKLWQDPRRYNYTGADGDAEQPESETPVFKQLGPDGGVLLQAAGHDFDRCVPEENPRLHRDEQQPVCRRGPGQRVRRAIRRLPYHHVDQ